MKKRILIFLFLSSFAFSVSAQEKEARQIDEFGILPCGDMLSRLHWIYTESQNSPDSKIYVVYYGGRFRKTIFWDQKNKSNKIQLKYPHQEDALNQAKSIPLYLTTEERYPAAIRDSLKNKIVLINGGFRQNIQMEIWIVPKDAAPPKPMPTIDEKDIKFRSNKPFGTPDYKRCYDYA